MIAGQLYFGDHRLHNMVIYKGTGGRGGGSVKVNSHHVQIDGKMTASGISADVHRGKDSGRWHVMGCFGFLNLHSLQYVLMHFQNMFCFNIIDFTKICVIVQCIFQYYPPEVDYL